MSLNSLILILASVCLSGVAQVAFKFGLAAVAARTERPWYAPADTLLTSGVIIGILLYGIGTLIWLAALSRTPLTQAYPFVSLSFLITAGAGMILFGETLSIQNCAGIALIVVGVVLVAAT